MTLRIGVLGLFRPRRLIVKAGRIRAGAEPLAAPQVELSIENSAVVCQAGTRRMAVPAVSAEDGVRLEIPGRIERAYAGAVTISAAGEELMAVVELPLETAVASAVAAEAPQAPEEALKAQAVVARSYYTATAARHGNFDFCDTTHCQFVRETPPAESAAMRAAMATRGLVLRYEERPFGAMFFRSCGGRTLTAEDVKLDPSQYPYFAVECPGCRSNPSRWEARVTRLEAARLPSENARLHLGRKYGWNRIASSDFGRSEDGDHVILRGVGEGHGLGLCQRGAAAMARSGKGYAAILAHYFPHSTLSGWRSR